MKKFFSLLFISILSGVITLLGYKYYLQQEDQPLFQEQQFFEQTTSSQTNIAPLNYNAYDFIPAANKAVKAVVHVKNVSYQKNNAPSILDYFYGSSAATKPKIQVGMGSGVIISSDGYIVTNSHVIQNASELEVTLNDNTIYKAVLIGSDKQSDIALLKIEPRQDLPYLEFADSDAIELAQWVLAVGNPFNLTSTVTAGIISAKARNLEQTGIGSFIQTDAVINPGNSGGALVNSQGELIGINTLISSNTGSYVGYGFAVPSNLAKKIVQDLTEFGRVQQAILGVSGAELNPRVAEHLNIDSTQGFYISSIDPRSDALNKGLQTGDIITHIDNKKIISFADLKNILYSKNPSDTVVITFIRNNKPMQTRVSLMSDNPNTVVYKGFSFEQGKKAKPNQRNSSIVITELQNPDYSNYKDALVHSTLITINDTKIDSIEDLQRLLDRFSNQQKIKVNIITQKGEYLSFLL